MVSLPGVVFAKWAGVFTWFVVHYLSKIPLQAEGSIGLLRIVQKHGMEQQNLTNAH
jgi:hypothetical protein